MTFVRNLLLWIVLFLIPITGFAFRDEIGIVARRVYAVLVPGAAVSTDRHEVTIARAGGNSFIVQTEVNGTPARMVFDTGASQVVLTPETAANAGIDVASLQYTAVVQTANGVTRAAPVTIATLTIGSITERRVPALVARPGDLFENLLGMSFLARLESYQVVGQRLILRGRGGK